MTISRKTVASWFTTDENGRITNPGQFQGEKLYVPYLWEMSAEGDSDREIETDGGDGYWVEINPDTLRSAIGDGWTELANRETPIRLYSNPNAGGHVSEVEWEPESESESESESE